MKSVDEQLELLRRGVDQIEPTDGLKKKLEKSLKTGKPLRVKYGIDPTGIDVHLGHTVPLRKLRLFQELGHQAVLIIGNYTALVGDPSGRDQTRAGLTPEQVEANAAIISSRSARSSTSTKPRCRRNGEWFSDMAFLDVMALTSKITVQRMLERDDFTKRFRAEPVDTDLPARMSVSADAGTGQRRDSGRHRTRRQRAIVQSDGRPRLQEDAGQEPQVCLTLPILRGLDGVRRMGKSLGNYIGVGEAAYDQFAKTMSIPDDTAPRVVRAADRSANRGHQRMD